MIYLRSACCAHPGAGTGRRPVARCRMPLTLMMILFFAWGVASTEIQAKEIRHPEAHEHGVAQMNVAVEGDNLYIEFSSPAANIVGFEHHPATHKQKQAVKAAIEKLKAGDKLFKLPSNAQGKLVKSVVHTDIVNEPAPHSEAGHDAEHGKHHDHDRHSDFKAEYRFVCKRPENLKRIEVMVFRLFPAVEHI